MAVLDRAEWLAQPRNYSGSGNWLDEANSHDAVNNGSMFLSHTGEQYLYLPEIDNNNADTPDSAALDITSDFDLRIRTALDDWTNQQYFIAKAPNTGATGYAFLVQVSGNLRMFVGDGGVNPIESTGPLVVSDGDTLWVRNTWAAVADDATFFFSVEPLNDDTAVTWTQLGAVVATGTNTLSTNGNVLSVGALSLGAVSLGGKIFRAVAYDNLTETNAVFDADFTDIAALVEPFASFIEAGSNATVTINRSATGLKAVVVDSPRWLRGTDDFHEIPSDAGLNFGPVDSFTILSAVRVYDPAADMILVAKKPDLTTGVGYASFLSGDIPSFVVSDGVTSVTATGPPVTSGVESVVTVVRDGPAKTLTVYTDGIAGTVETDTTTLTLSNSEVMRLGRLSGAGTSYIDGEDAGGALLREALTSADIVTAGIELVDGTFPDTAVSVDLSAPGPTVTLRAVR